MTSTLTFDLERIERDLFENESLRAEIIADYGLTPSPKTPRELADLLVTAFGQESPKTTLADASVNDCASCRNKGCRGRAAGQPQ